MTIVLNAVEQSICKYLANKRDTSNIDSGVRNALISPKITSLQANLEGMGAEMAFCKMFNIYPDLDVEPRSGGYDCLTRKGMKVDVKANRYYFNAHLVVRKTKQFKDSDIYALMVGEFPEYRFAGYLNADEIMKDENITNWGYDDCYSLHESKLKGVV